MSDNDVINMILHNERGERECGWKPTNPDGTIPAAYWGDDTVRFPSVRFETGHRF